MTNFKSWYGRDMGYENYWKYFIYFLLFHFYHFKFCFLKKRNKQGKTSYLLIIKVSVRVFLPTPQHGQYVTQGQFLSEVNRLEFRVFLPPIGLPNRDKRTQFALLFTHSWRENYWIHTFPKSIRGVWNAVNLVQVRNRVDFFGLYLLLHGFLQTKTREDKDLTIRLC